MMFKVKTRKIARGGLGSRAFQTGGTYPMALQWGYLRLLHSFIIHSFGTFGGRDVLRCFAFLLCLRNPGG